MVDATIGYEQMKFLDAYSGYNQIPMAEEDRINTVFKTERGLYCYIVKSFWLRNAGATYQLLVNKIFAEQLGWIMEVSIDDMVVKFEREADHLTHLAKCFKAFNRYNMKLNPAKCALGCFKKSSQTLWGDEQRKAFEELKSYLSSPPVLSALVLSAPEQDEELYMYLVVTSVVVSATLFKEVEGKQKPIFYVSKTLLDAETRYSMLEKLVLALMTTKKRLRQYFETHVVVVLTKFSLKQILAKPDLSGSMSKWAIDHSAYDVSRRLIWVMSMDGSVNSSLAGIGVVLEAPFGLRIEDALKLQDKVINIEALIYRLELASSLGIKQLQIRTDSKLVSEQVPREMNRRIEKLAMKASSGKCTRKSLVILSTTKVDGCPACFEIWQPNECWMDPIIQYLKERTEPDIMDQSRSLKAKVARYTLINEQFYRMSFNCPCLRCLNPNEAKSLIEEIHEGICGNHSGGWSLAHKALTAGYYWSYMMTEAGWYAKMCDRCQRHAPLMHQPAQPLHSIVAP
ncbi:uncharacterized protein LOC133795918 [Humulus lupulus]|uniref:uncharacterized protein LOC133795918 n=1 Tax=Humulus lupulus TaxID=3486 RepID=UPI002B417D19|nr:uncharacterized protein LOC133795918 [Humulus lupulus]